jgi:hypothetical protein
MLTLPPSVRIYLATTEVDMRRYAESSIMPSREECWCRHRGETSGRTPHNHEPGREGCSEASSLSGARKRPRLKAGGSTASMALSFSVGSART